jgi:hypothetical protein
MTIFVTALNRFLNHFGILILVVHVCSFNGYALSTLLHMLIVTWLFDLSGRRRSTKLVKGPFRQCICLESKLPLCFQGEHSYQYKVFTSIGAVISLGLVIYFYIRHNKYCEPGIYSLFALSEYMLITCNFLFYSTLYYDFKSGILTLISSPSLQQYNLLLNNYDDKKTWFCLFFD